METPNPSESAQTAQAAETAAAENQSKAAESGAAAPEPGPSLAAKVFSFPSLMAVGLLFLLCWTSRERFQDPDMWWHLEIGRQIWETGSIPQVDELSFTTGNHAWIAHEWLADLTIYAAYRMGGLQGLSLWLLLTGGALLVVLYAYCCLYSGNSKTALVGGLIGWFFATITLSVRPLMLGHLFLVVELLLLELGRTRDRRWLAGLPVLFVLWVNCHGSFVLGLAAAALYAAVGFLDFRWGLIVARPWPRQTARWLAWAAAGCGAAVFVNPFGVDLVAYPFNVMLEQSSNLNFIYEWRTLDFADPRGVGLFVLLGSVVLLVLAAKKEVYVEELVLTAVGAYLALQHMRMLFVFGILIAPAVCRLIADEWDQYDPRQDKPLINAAAIAVAIFVSAVRFPSTEELQLQSDAANPVKAVEYMRENGVSGRVLNEYVWGGYLIWALPEQKTFIDGRTDIFDWTGVLDDYMGFYNAAEDPRRVLEKYDISHCLLSRAAPVNTVLAYLPEWEQVYSDESAVIFARRGSAGAAGADDR